jgi:hypothetical protein
MQKNSDLNTRALPVSSYIRPDKLFTAERIIITKKVATIKPLKLAEFKQALSKFLGLNA